MAHGDNREKLDENVVEHARNGERFVFHPRKPDGTLPFDFVVRAQGRMAMRHFHLDQDEWFRCVSGALTIHLAGGDRVLRAGEEINLPAGTVHAFSNPGVVDAVCDVEYRPGGRNEEWLKLVCALEHSLGREPSLLDLAPFIGDVGIYIEGPPAWMQRALFAVLKVIATALGRRERALAAASARYGRPFTWD